MFKKFKTFTAAIIALMVFVFSATANENDVLSPSADSPAALEESVHNVENSDKVYRTKKEGPIVWAKNLVAQAKLLYKEKMEEYFSDTEESGDTQEEEPTS